MHLINFKMGFQERDARKLEMTCSMILLFKLTITKANLDYLGIFKLRYSFLPAKHQGVRLSI